MKRKDLFLFLLWGAALLALLAPAWFLPGTALFNFGDLYAYHYPLRHLAASSLQAGRLPFWNPYILAGLPLAANPQSVLFYPVSLLGAFFPLTLAFSWDYAFHLLWGGLGTALLARHSRLGPSWAALLAVLFAFSPFLVYRITEGIPTLLASLAWAPWAWLALLSGRAGLLAAGWALQLLSGHPQFMAANALGMGLWALCQPGRSVRSRVFTGGGLGALALTAAQWIPTWEFLGLSVRRYWPSAFTASYSVDLQTLWTWLHPDAWGNPLDRTFAGPPSVFFETSAVHIGVLGLLLAAAGLALGRRRAVPAVLIALGVFLASGEHNPAAAALLRAGPLSFLRTAARWLFLSFWGLLLAAGAGARRLERWAKPSGAFRTLVFAAALIELVVWDARFLKTESAAPYLDANPALAVRIGGVPMRVLTDPGLANTDKTMLYRAMNVNGYEAFYLAPYPAYAARSEGGPAADPSRTYLRRADTPEMRRLGVAYAITPRGTLLPNPGAYPLAYFAGEDGEEVKAPPDLRIEIPERWVVRGFWPAGARRLVLAQAFYPGWRAWLNGAEAPLESWDGLVQSVSAPKALPVGAGFELRASYAPTGWPLWAGLSALAWVVWLLSLGKALSPP